MELPPNAVLAEVRLASLGAVESHATDLEKQLATLRNHFIAAQNIVLLHDDNQPSGQITVMDSITTVSPISSSSMLRP